MAKYQGRTVKLNKPMRGDTKKFKVFVKDKTSGRVKKVNFGSKTMKKAYLLEKDHLMLEWVVF